MVNVDEFIEDATASICDQIGDEYTIATFLGDVDSSVVATLVHEAAGGQLTLVYVDTGLMRKGKTGQIVNTFSFTENPCVVDARDRFFDAFGGVADPEEKRKIIDEQFTREFEREAKETDAQYLVQRTIYPDCIESEGNIRSHHNVGGLPDVVDFEGIAEPVHDLYRDEVREVVCAFGFESITAERIPFPGLGLAVRVLGEVTFEKVQVARDVCHVVEGETEKHDPWQMFAAVTGKGIGVRGDNRVHGWIVSVCSVESHDGMTARTRELPWDTLRRTQSHITGTNENVARAVYDVTHKPPATIEYEWRRQSSRGQTPTDPVKRSKTRV